MEPTPSRSRLRPARLVSLLLGLAVTVGLFAVAAPGEVDAQSPGLPPVTDFAAAGPFQVTVEPASAHTYYSPTTLGQGGIDHPIILWGNGTGASPSTYDGFLRHLASHGFVVAAANTTNAGSGNEMLAGLDNLTAFNSQSGSRYFGNLDLGHVGASGHSQGAGGAISVTRDPRIDTIFPLQGYGSPRGTTASAIYFAGQNDTIIQPSTVRGSYNASTGIPAAYAELAGATHFTPLGNAGGFRGPATAWARWHLAGDLSGRSLFVGANCGLCTSAQWEYEANARLQNLTPPSSTTSSSVPGSTTSSTQPTGQCIQATNAQHLEAGRAERRLFFIRAVGSGDVLGFSFQSSALRQTAPGTWERVEGC